MKLFWVIIAVWICLCLAGSLYFTVRTEQIILEHEINSR